MPGVSGCLEHTAVLSQLIKEAKAEKKSLVITWLDIANAYRSLPHWLILSSLRRAHVPEEMCTLIAEYYSDVKIRFSTKEFTTEWQKVEKGIITGCTLSVIVFALAMSMLIAEVKRETKGPKTKSGQQQVNSRLFMDDIATTTETLVQTKYLLDKMAEKLDWAELEVRPEKCRSLVIIDGKLSRRTPTINNKPITSITEKPIKYLGKTYNRTLNDREQTKDILEDLEKSLKKLEKCRVPGRYKAWMVQNTLIPKLIWPLTIYEIPETKVKEMQGKITMKLKKWLGLPRSLSVECLYTKTGKLQLPLKELSEEVKAAKARLLVTLQEAQDPCVSEAGATVDGGRKANTEKGIKEAKEKLCTEEIVGIPNKGREGFGLNPKRYWSKTSSMGERRSMIVDKIKEAEEERRRVKMQG